MKKLIAIITLLLISTALFAQTENSFGLLKIYSPNAKSSDVFEIKIANQEPFEVRENQLIIYKIYSTGGMLIKSSNEFNTKSIYVDLDVRATQNISAHFTNNGDFLELIKESTAKETYEGEDLDTIFLSEDLDHPIKYSANSGVPVSGTGFLISGSGVVVTNSHVIEKGRKITVKGVGGDKETKYTVKVLLDDKINDIALLKIDDANFKLDSIPYNIRSSGIETGEEVFTLGYPLTTHMGEEIKLTTGVVSSKSGYQGTFSSYQVSCTAQPGNSGSPLFDRNGNLIGIINAKLRDSEGVTYAIKITYLNSILESSETKNELLDPVSTIARPLVDLVKKYSNYVFIVEVTR